MTACCCRMATTRRKLPNRPRPALALALQHRAVARRGQRQRIATAGEHLKGVGAGLDRAVRKYNDFVGSFERNVLTSGRRLRDKGIAIGKRELEDVALIESSPRYGEATSLPEPDAANDEAAA